MTDIAPTEDNQRPIAAIGIVDGPQHPAASNAARRVLRLSRLTLFLATILVGLSAGFFFTYEASVTLGLAQVSDVTYVETFQAINNTIRNTAFGIVFFGPIPAIALAVIANWRTAAPVARGLLAAALPLYLAGLIITGTGNIPLNNDLADVATITPETAAVARAAFEDDWNQLNLLRTIAVVASFATLAAAGTLLPTRDDDDDDDDEIARQTG